MRIMPSFSLLIARSGFMIQRPLRCYLAASSRLKCCSRSVASVVWQGSIHPVRLDSNSSPIRSTVHNLNRALVRQADRFVYSPFDADYIQDELQKSRQIKGSTQ